MATYAGAQESTSRRSLTVLAWVVTLLISALPQIVPREFLGIDAPWMPSAVVLVTIGLWLASRVVTVLAPLEPPASP